MALSRLRSHLITDQEIKDEQEKVIVDIRGFNTVNSYRTNFILVNKAGAEMDEIKNGFIDVTHEPSSLFYEKGELVDGILEITSNSLMATAPGITSSNDSKILCSTIRSAPLITSCGHNFCYECFMSWITKHNTCRICRQQLTVVRQV